MPNVQTFALTTVRAAQLRMLAERLGLSIAETVETMINEKVEAGFLPAALPFLTVAAEDGAISLTIGAVEVPLPNNEAASLASTIRDLTSGRTTGKTIHAEIMVAVSRVGAGFAVECFTDRGIARVATSRSVIEELARQLESASKNAAELQAA